MLLPSGSSTKRADVARVVVRPLTRRAVVGEPARRPRPRGTPRRSHRRRRGRRGARSRSARPRRTRSRVRADVLDPVGRVVLQADPDERRHRLPEAALGRNVARTKPEMVDPAGAARRRLVHGLGAVTARVPHEGAVVVLAVVRPRPRLAVALVAGAGQPLPPCIDVRGARHTKADMQVARDRRVVDQAELVPLDVLARVRRLPERELVEAPARRRGRRRGSSTWSNTDQSLNGRVPGTVPGTRPFE